MLTLLTVEECTGLDCPFLSLPWLFIIYIIVMILTCCCCYPGSCICPQRQIQRDRDTNKPMPLQSPWHAQLNLLGSIGQVLSSEWPADSIKNNIDEDEDDDDDEGKMNTMRRNTMLKRRKRIQY